MNLACKYGEVFHTLQVYLLELSSKLISMYVRLPDGSLVEITKVYPLDAVFDCPEDVPEDVSLSLPMDCLKGNIILNSSICQSEFVFCIMQVKSNKRYAGSSNWTVKVSTLRSLVHS